MRVESSLIDAIRLENEVLENRIEIARYRILRIDPYTIQDTENKYQTTVPSRD